MAARALARLIARRRTGYLAVPHEGRTAPWRGGGPRPLVFPSHDLMRITARTGLDRSIAQNASSANRSPKRKRVGGVPLAGASGYRAQHSDQGPGPHRGIPVRVTRGFEVASSWRMGLQPPPTAISFRLNSRKTSPAGKRLRPSSGFMGRTGVSSVRGWLPWRGCVVPSGRSGVGVASLLPDNDLRWAIL